MADRKGRFRTYLPSALLLAAIILISLLRLRLLQVPLERDEGEYAYMGQLILNGFPPYSVAYSLKLPGIFFAYAGILKIFGQSTAGIRLGLLAVNIVTIVLLFLLAKDLYGEYAGAAAGASYAVLSLNPSVLGMFSHATHFVALFVAGGLFLFRKIVDSNRSPLYFLLCGLFFGIGFTMKQHALFFIALPILYLFVQSIREKHPYQSLFQRSVFYLLGAIIPLTAICLYSYRSGVWDKFRFWTFDYAREYVSETPLEIGMRRFVSNTLDMIEPSAFLWLLAGVGLVSLIFRQEFRRHRFFMLSFLIVSVLAIFPGFFFREHYYIMLLPSASLLIGISILELKIRLEKYKLHAGLLAFVILIGATVHSLYYNGDILLFDTPEKISRAIYGNNPFVESLPVAKYIEENTSPNDRILVLGSEPQIYFYSKRLSATGHIYMYGLMEHQKYAQSMQQEMIREIVSADPKVIVVFTAMTSWLFGPDSDRTILDWANRYAAEKFDLVGIADKIGPDRTIFLWNRDALQYVPQSGSVIYLFRKKRFA